MRHLYSSRCEVLRVTGSLIDGTPTVTWQKATDLFDASLGVPGELMCRLDLVFQRPGKDAPMPIVAGRAPDRVGVCFFTADPGGPLLRAGDRLHCLGGPVTGIFEVRAVPDAAIGFSAAHHHEVQIVETAQQPVGVYPGADLEQ